MVVIAETLFSFYFAKTPSYSPAATVITPCEKPPKNTT